MKVQLLSVGTIEYEIYENSGIEKIRSLCKLLLDYPVKFSLRCFMKAGTFNETDIYASDFGFMLFNPYSTLQNLLDAVEQWVR